MPSYIKLFNKVLETGNISEDWLIGIIVPIYKNNGDMLDVNNYRGIPLLNCIGKLFTTILNARLMEFSENNSIIKEIKAGFREGYSTIEHAFLIKNLLDLFLSRKKKLYSLYIDYRKAFNFVWRNALWNKLLKAGFNRK